jgi:hypothetical protein
MLPGFKPLKLYKGDTFAFRLTLDVDSNDYNITNHTFVAQIKEKGKSAITAEFDYVIEDGPEGIVLLTLPSSESSKLIGGKKYEYDVQMNNAGTISTILKGPVVVVADISS